MASSVPATVSPYFPLDIIASTEPIQDMTGLIRIGTQGWNYDAWVGPFYPLGTRAVDYLTIYSRAFDTVEVVGTRFGNLSTAPARSYNRRCE